MSPAAQAPAARLLLDVVRLSAGYLAARGSATPRLDAELLAAHALGLRRLDLYLQFERPLAGGELEAIRGLLRRRAAGEPVAYLTGVREFYGRPMRVTPAVLVPRPETETLVERALAWARRVAGEGGEGLRLADAGTGSGCIALTLAAELPAATVVACDVSPAAVEVAAGNARRAGVAERVVLVEGGWGEALAAHGPVDALVSNPPYVTTSELETLDRDVRDFEPRGALDGGADGLDSYRELAAAARSLLRRPGYLAVEVDPRRAAAVAGLLAEALPAASAPPAVVADLAGRPRVVELETAAAG